MADSSEINPVVIDQLRESYPDIEDRLKSEAFVGALSAVTQASRFLTRLLFAEPASLDTLSTLDARVDPPRAGVDELVQWKRLEMLRIAARDLTGQDQLDEVGANLASLADDVLTEALRIAGGSDEIVIVGMGKLGGRELNYASDVDVMFVGEGDEHLPRAVMEITRNCFRVDANLRPEGRDGSLLRSLTSFETYWEEWADTWEFQALLKARAISGPADLREAWTQSSEERLWTKSFGPDELRALRDMKRRTEQLLARRGLAEREVKRGKGGIRDIEFAVQLLQLVHGGKDPDIRSRTTLTALGQLADGGYIASEDSFALGESYRFLRTVEHRLQLVEEEQTHTLPTDRESRDLLAAVLGYRGREALTSFENDLRSCQLVVRQAHERLYFRPLLEAFASESTDTSGAVETQLAAFGFSDANRTRVAIKELTRGLARSSRLMQQLMPLLLDWLSASPDPDEGLLGLRTLIAGFRTPAQIVNVFRDSPEVARRLCLLLGTGRVFSQSFTQHPELISDIGSDETLVSSTPVIERLRTALEWRTEEARHEALLRLARSERMRIAAADVLDSINDTEAARRRTELADAVLQITLDDIQPKVPVALIGMGRFGGGELAYVSDLDMIIVYEGDNPTDQAAAEDVAMQLLQRVGSTNPALQLYKLDYDLRPEGKKGVLARSITGCRDYYDNWASHWERQALVRARPVAGDSNVASAFMQLVKPFVWDRLLGAEATREMRHLKARMERERIPRGGDPEFHLKLGRGSLSDVEWTVQFLQLQYGLEEPNTLRALHQLHREHRIHASDMRMLDDAWRFCDSARNRLYLVSGNASDSLPANLHTLKVLARSLDIPELRERYRQVTRRSRNVVERLFYGRPQ